MGKSTEAQVKAEAKPIEQLSKPKTLPIEQIHIISQLETLPKPEQIQSDTVAEKHNTLQAKQSSAEPKISVPIVEAKARPEASELKTTAKVHEWTKHHSKHVETKPDHNILSPDTELLAHDNALEELNFYEPEPVQSEQFTEEPIKVEDMSSETQPNNLLEDLPFVVPEENIGSAEQSQSFEAPTIAQQIQEVIERLQPEQAQEAMAIIELITEKFKTIIEYGQDLSEITDEQLEELEQYTARFLTCMGIESTSKNIKQFMNLLFSELKQKSMELPEITDEGTHEIKNVMAQLFDDFGALIQPSMLVLGRYAMTMAVSDHKSENVY